MPGITRAGVIVAILTVVAIVLAVGAATAYGEESEGGEEIPISFTPAKPKIVDHTEYFREAGITKYEGSASCIKRHEDEVMQVFHSYHYQLASRVYDIIGKDSVFFGGRAAYNGFCTAIFLDNGTKPLNWIGYVVLEKAPEGYENLVGSFTGLTGCSMCHGVGMGLPP